MSNSLLPFSKADNTLETLNRFRDSYTVSELIEGIKKIRSEIGFLPSFMTEEYGSFYSLFKFIAHHKTLKPHDAMELSDMLLSRADTQGIDEYQLEQLYFCILTAIDKVTGPDQQEPVREGLKKHFKTKLDRFAKHLKTQMNEAGPGTPRYALFAEDLKLTEKILERLE